MFVLRLSNFNQALLGGVLALCAGLPACKKPGRTAPHDKPIATPAQPSGSAKPQLSSPSIDSGSEPTSEKQPDSGVRREREVPEESASTLQGLIVDEVADIAAAGPARAHGTGIIMITKNDELRLARKTRIAEGKKPGPSGFSVLSDEASAFMPYARGPAIAGNHAYWIAKRRLLRRRIDQPGELEILATDAREGTRVSAHVFPKGTAVGYVAFPEGAEAAQVKLWLEGGKTFALSPEGAGASSVSVIPLGEHGIAVSIDARTAMTPLHGRKFRVDKGNVELSADVVMWVGASAQSLSEVFSTNVNGSAWALLPIERDVSHFGLASIEIGVEPHMDLPVQWRSYPNGLDVAPVASATFCGRTYVAYARPVEARPGSPSELQLSELGADGLGAAMPLANASAFSDVSLAPAPFGAVLAYVADRRTWARVIRCSA